MLTDERRVILERNALRWIRVVLRTARHLSLFGLGEQLTQLATGKRTSDEWLIDAHLIGVAFRQIEQHLIHMQPYRTEALRLAAEQYINEYQSQEIKTLRDMLEHAAEYIGEAKTAKKTNLPYVRVPSAPISFGSGVGGSQSPIWIYVFGREYRIDPILNLAAALEKPLAILCESPKSQTRGGNTAGD